MDDAIWASEKAISKHQSDWKEALILMQEIGFRPQLLTFRSWLWASATVSQWYYLKFMLHVLLKRSHGRHIYVRYLVLYFEFSIH